MARYKEYSYAQGKFISIHFDNQILPNTFEYTLNYLIDNEIDLSIFEKRYNNDETGAPAYDPSILLKIVLFAYSRGIVSSRKIARCCCENTVFMALSADTRPHFTTIADFVSSMEDEVILLFRDVLLYCDEIGLIGKEMFAIDGCRLPSNASKEWSGTKEEFKKKQKKMEGAIRRILKKHKDLDLTDHTSDIIDNDKKYIETLKKQINKLKNWMKENDDKPGKQGPIKSNITDNESAKIKSGHGVIQGYDGIASVDSKHQVIAAAVAYGESQEHDLLKPMIEATRENLKRTDSDDDVFDKAILTADAGFHTEANMEMLIDEEIDAYVADRFFRKRDPRFVDAKRYKEIERARNGQSPRKYTPDDFKFDKDFKYCMCPAGERLNRTGDKVIIRGAEGIRFQGKKSFCTPCQLRSKCLFQYCHLRRRVIDGKTR